MLSIKEARLAVRMSSCKDFDAELTALQEAAIADLKAVGVAEMANDQLYDNALRMYLRGHFEVGAPDAKDCREIYEDIKITMKNTDRYRVGDGDA